MNLNITEKTPKVKSFFEFESIEFAKTAKDIKFNDIIFIFLLVNLGNLVKIVFLL